jgi:hypothetical protein
MFKLVNFDFINNERFRHLLHRCSVCARSAFAKRESRSVSTKSRMNKAFQGAVNYYKHAPTLTHKQEVMRLYRRYEKILAAPFVILTKNCSFTQHSAEHQ